MGRGTLTDSRPALSKLDRESSSQNVQATLHIKSGPDSGRSFLVRNGEVCCFGASERAADVKLPDDAYLADRQFSLDCTGSDCVLRDLGSDCGTFVNGERQLECVIRTGDSIVAGQTEFGIDVEGDRQSSEAVSELPLPFPTTIDAEWPYDSGVTDSDPHMRWTAFIAAASSRQPWLLDYCRLACDHPVDEHWQAVLMLAILGEPSDLSRLLGVARATELGPKRFSVLGVYGHPGAVRELLVRIESTDTETAFAAGEAFRKITGFTDEPTPETGGSPEPEHALGADAKIGPDMARRYWQQECGRFELSSRWCRGVDVSQQVNPAILRQLDLESVQQIVLREHFRGWRTAQPIVLHEFSNADHSGTELD